MGVNKNFVVKNGLEVATNVILADATTKNVGIGSTSPTFKLDVQGGIGVTDSSVFSVNSSSDALRITQTGTGNALLVEDSANPDSSPFVITGIGSVGIGTSVPQATLDVEGNVRVLDDLVVRASDGSDPILRFQEPTDGWNIRHEGSDNSLKFAPTYGGTDLITVTSSGDVGIGTSVPTDAASPSNTNILNVGVVTANNFYGDGSGLTGLAPGLTGTIGVRSEGTYIGAGVTQLDFRTTTGTNIQSVEIDSTTGIATVTIEPGTSLGLAIALGG